MSLKQIQILHLIVGHKRLKTPANQLQGIRILKNLFKSIPTH